MTTGPAEPATLETVRERFIRAATWHGGLAEAKAILAEFPALAVADIHLAAISGDDAAVARFLAADPASVHACTGPLGVNGADALALLCLSKFLRLDDARTPAFVRAATALLDAGADANTGFWTSEPNREYESALYGAAGVAHHPELTALLLARGADPNDEEVPYHAPESYDNRALALLVESGQLTPESLAIMLVRKCDWHDEAGLRYLLAHGADANGARKRGWLALHHALRRDNALAMITALLDHGADPHIISGGITALARAARPGRSDVIAEFGRRGLAVALDGVDGVIAACAIGDTERANALLAASPVMRGQLLAMGGELLGNFSGTGNPSGVRALLDVGVPVTAPHVPGDAYWGIPAGSQALHVAAWRLELEVVRTLLERGAPVDAPDPAGRTSLARAIHACVDSYWMERRSPEIVRALLAAGASAGTVPFPCGYAEVDLLLRSAGRR